MERDTHNEPTDRAFGRATTASPGPEKARIAVCYSRPVIAGTKSDALPVSLEEDDNANQ